jgi:nucleoside 2-deoxyribosyltransferase
VKRAIYMAGPWGFTEPGRVFYAKTLLPRLRQAGYSPLDPWRAGRQIVGPVLSSPRRNPGRVLAACDALGAANEAMLRRAHGVLALLDGCDLDSGTCAEVGFAAGLGLPIVGLRTDLRSAGDFPEIPINLQVLYFVNASGGQLVGTLSEAMSALSKVCQAT